MTQNNLVETVETPEQYVPEGVPKTPHRAAHYLALVNYRGCGAWQVEEFSLYTKNRSVSPSYVIVRGLMHEEKNNIVLTGFEAIAIHEALAQQEGQEGEEAYEKWKAENPKAFKEALGIQSDS